MLWALGTVLGRYLGRELEFQQILTLRFFFGLIASAVALADHRRRAAFAGGHDSLWIAYLAVVTGLSRSTLYYYRPEAHARRARRRSPSSRIPAIAVIAGIYAYNSHLRWTQWIGVATIIVVVSLLPVQRRRSMVKVPAPPPTQPALAST